MTIPLHGPADLAIALAGRYAIERELGRGGMAVVYLARDTRHGRPVALKVLRGELTSGVPAERFLREIAIAASLVHPNVLAIHDSGEAAGYLYYVMPFVDGPTLQQRLARETQLPIDEALRIAGQIAAALDYAHAHGVVHRDIKPGNILLLGDHVLVADFGLARADSSVASMPLTRGTVLGTPAYMSPEQCSSGRLVDGRSDVYSLACVVFEMIAGVPPFRGATATAMISHHLSSPPPSVCEERESCPPLVDRALRRGLAKAPADRFRTAGELWHAMLGEGMREVTVPASAPPPRPPDDAFDDGRAQSRGDAASSMAVRWLRRRRALAAAALLAAVALCTVQLVRTVRRNRSPLDATLVAVAPFDVPEPGLGLWHEGMTDVLSRTLDGAGPLRTVSPARVIRSWQGHADRESAAALGHATGAGLVVVGSIVRAGADSLRVTATLVDAQTGKILTEVVRRDEATRMDRLTDAIALAIIQSVSTSEPVAAVRQQGLASTTSMEALKAFLEGEQFFRRAQWARARQAYDHALSIDSSFALALRRVGMVASWQRLQQDSAAMTSLLRAGASNHGLAPRDSLLVAADSIVAAISTTSDEQARWGLTRRLFATFDVATQRYAEDPEVWFALGEARYHHGFGPVLGVPDRATLDAFDRAIALDSSFAPAYLHAVELALNLGGDALGRRYARAYLALNPTEAAHRGVLLVEPLLEPGRAQSPEAQRMLDTASAGALVSARTITRRWPDSAETAVRLSRLLAAGRPSEYPLFADTAFMRRRLVQELAFRGHLTEAARLVGTRDTTIFAELALLGGIPTSVAARTFAQWLAAGSRSARLALGWWATQRDTASIHAFAAGRLGARRAGPARGHAATSYDVQAAEAYSALARGDSAEALRRFVALPDTLCVECYADRLVRGRLRLSRGQASEALTDLRESLATFLSPLEVTFALERARAARRMGNPGRAALDYRFVARAWQHGDASLGPLLAEAREGAR